MILLSQKLKKQFDTTEQEAGYITSELFKNMVEWWNKDEIEYLTKEHNFLDKIIRSRISHITEMNYHTVTCMRFPWFNNVSSATTME
jgi:hypothetical protein